ncbi:hypothetical protein B5X24_HaOG213923 [Helicoverpa armigera]|uniref:Uncharacterized protein n=1 Tax=Helicoverpa armigera TaxID=29058 RepID=A0A2W1B8H4_HELAM|nr:hypothetical protein B5X24_HaOG213923 [Helicoverpa armigera]
MYTNQAPPPKEEPKPDPPKNTEAKAKVTPPRPEINPDLIHKHPFNKVGATKPLNLTSSVLTCYYSTFAGLNNLSEKAMDDNTRLKRPIGDLKILAKAKSFGSNVTPDWHENTLVLSNHVASTNLNKTSKEKATKEDQIFLTSSWPKLPKSTGLKATVQTS